MRILIDLTYVNDQSSSGVTIYANRLLNGLKRYNKADRFLLLVTKKNKSHIEINHPKFKTINLDVNYGFIEKYFPFFKGYTYKKTINKIIVDNNVSLFFSPYLNMNSLFTTVTKQVGVLHDAQSYVFTRQQGLKGFIYRTFTDCLLKRMSNIVTISNYAKKSILKEIPQLDVPITVIYNSVDELKFELENRYEDNQPYILFVNTLMPYKNLETLVRAFGILKDKVKHNLIVKAKELPYWKNVIQSILDENGITDRVILIQDNYSSEEIAKLYNNADLFVTTSRKEGFGYTPIEAAIYKTPVISSKESALYETTLGLLNYYEPVDDFIVLAEKIDYLLHNKPSSDELTKISERFIETYSVTTQSKLFNELFEIQIQKI
jgi:glycosyltransferase involved in cell wall biosynthesis